MARRHLVGSSLSLDGSDCFPVDVPSEDGKYDGDYEEEEENQEGADLDGRYIWERELSVKCCENFPVFVGWDHSRQ